MNIKCFFGFHDYHVIGKCYKVEQLMFNAWMHKYAVMQCSGCHGIELKDLNSEFLVTTHVVTPDEMVVHTNSLEKQEAKLKADGWIPYEDLVLTKGEYL